MRTSRFGKTDLKPSAIGFGCSRIASATASHSRKDAIAAMEAAFERGINFYDTADIYGQGDSERLIARVFAKRRSKLIICSKAGFSMGATQSIVRFIKPFAKVVLNRVRATRSAAVQMRARQQQQCFEPGYIQRQIESSLRRLRTDYLDVFLLHSPPAQVIKDDALFETLDRLKSRGMLRHYGVACGSLEDALIAAKRSDVACLQVPVSLMNWSEAETVLRATRQADIAVVAREPFAGGAVFAHEALRRAAANDRTRTLAQAALQFCLGLDGVGVVLGGMNTPAHVLENLDAVDLPPLSPAETSALQRAAAGAGSLTE